MKNIWLLTEEMPKAGVIQIILSRVGIDNNFQVNGNELRIEPIMNNGHFTFTFKVTGVSCEGFENVYIKIASGDSSFVDFLVFLQEAEPDQSAIPLYAIEETKTDDSESRNTGVYQRCSKFVYVEFYYPGIKKIMLYNLQIKQKEKPTSTNIFGTRMLRTIGVEILGKDYDDVMMRPFTSLEEFIQVKNEMRKPPASNTPIQIEAHADAITVSGRLFKNEGIGHDPNIGALTIIALCIRKWEPTKPIVITNHGLSQGNLGRDNKFIQIASRLNIGLAGLTMPNPTTHEGYWHYETSQEKMGTIFLHIVLQAYTDGQVIYANHGGSERGYFFHKTQGPIVIKKYQEGQREAYKLGDKTLIIHLPDMIIFDPERNEVISVEGKKYTTRKLGIEELSNYDYIEQAVIIPSHNPSSLVRTVVVFGSNKEAIEEKEIGFMLNENGSMVLSENSPEIFKEAIAKTLAA